MNEVQNKGDILLKKWLDGDLTWQEERELVQLAKEDSMLADAMAGLYAASEKDHTTKISQLKEQLKKATSEKPARRIFYLRSAAVVAAVAMIGGLAFGMWYFWEHKPFQRQLAVESQQSSTLNSKDQQDVTSDLQEKHPITAVETPSASEINSQKKEKPFVAPPKLEEIPIQTVDAPATIAQADAVEETPIAPAEKESARNIEEAVVLPESAKPQAPAKKIPGDKQMFNNAASSARTISGQVTDAANEPLIGATVLVKGTTIGTVTDIGGNFNLAVPMDAPALVISYTGYTSQEIPIGQNTRINVTMDANGLALDEVVIIGYGKNRTLRKEQVVAAPQPVGGFKKMERYIRRNLRYPATAKKVGLEGVVEVIFQIEADGSLSDFQVEKSLGYGCDEEAIRLLREGPKWKLRNLIIQRDSARYTVAFSLKK